MRTEGGGRGGGKEQKQQGVGAEVRGDRRDLGGLL